MLFFIRFRGTEYRVRVEARDDQTFVSYNGGPEEITDLFVYGNDVTSIEKNHVFSANVVGQKADYTVFRPEGNISFQLESEYRRIVGLLRGQDLGNESNVYARMPGKIVKIMTKVGNTVAKGDSLLVMEAMKMENEIRSTAAGEVTRICVAEGQAVETGSVLVELTPLDS